MSRHRQLTIKSGQDAAAVSPTTRVESPDSALCSVLLRRAF